MRYELVGELDYELKAYVYKALNYRLMLMLI